jgi:polysaccharide biosynthesis transport protein
LRGDYETTPTEGVTFSDYLDVVRRRKWLIFLVAVLVFISAILLTTRQQVRYSASARVIEPRTSSTTGSNSQVQRSSEAEASLARIPAIAALVIKSTGVDMSTEEFLADSSVTAGETAAILDFTVRAANPALAVKLVNAYTSEFATYRSNIGEAEFDRAQAKLDDSLQATEEELVRARAAEGADSTNVTLLEQQYQGLLDQQERLFATQGLSSSSVVSVPAERAVRVGPHRFRYGLLALAFGLVLGTVIAFVREAVDPRPRGAGEIGERLGLPLLARVPPPPRQLASQGKLVMLEDPAAPAAEPFRILRANLDFANMTFGGRTIMLTSASESEGRTTTLANLGIALARSGRHVILADLDLRRPRLGRLFDLGDRPGVTDVAVKRIDLDDALAPIAFADPEGRDTAAEANDGWGQIAGVLEVLPAGSAPPDPGDFVGTQSLAEILNDLRERSDFVLIDSPPLLSVADGVALSGNVDAMIVVVRFDVSRRHTIDELRRVLDVSPAPKLGYVLTGVDVEAPYPRETEAVRTPAGKQQARVETAGR